MTTVITAPAYAFSYSRRVSAACTCVRWSSTGGNPEMSSDASGARTDGVVDSARGRGRGGKRPESLMMELGAGLHHATELVPDQPRPPGVSADRKRLSVGLRATVRDLCSLAEATRPAQPSSRLIFR